MHWNAVLDVLSQKDASQNLFSGIDTTNTSPSLTEFWLKLCVSKPIFFRKIALVIL
jgi:hypothetical protein